MSKGPGSGSVFGKQQIGDLRYVGPGGVRAASADGTSEGSTTGSQVSPAGGAAGMFWCGRARDAALGFSWSIAVRIVTVNDPRQISNSLELFTLLLSAEAPIS